MWFEPNCVGKSTPIFQNIYIYIYIMVIKLDTKFEFLKNFDARLIRSQKTSESSVGGASD